MTAEEKALKAYPNIKICEQRIDQSSAREVYVEGYNQAEKDYIEYAQLWVDSGEVNIKSFKQFLKDRGYE
jgi:hypothetical protein